MGSTTSSTSAAITAPPASIEPPGPRPSRPGPRSPAWPLGHKPSCDRPSCAVSRPGPIKLTVPSSTRHAPATPLAHHGQLRRNHLGLARRCELLCLIEPEPEVGQARLRATLHASNLGFRHHAGPQLCNELHPPHQFRHQPTLFP